MNNAIVLNRDPSGVAVTQRVSNKTLNVSSQSRYNT